MAGIGFRLKRLIAEESYGGWLRAHLYGAVLSSGPWLLSIFTLASLSLLSRGIVDDPARDLFRTIVAWTYSFSLVTTARSRWWSRASLPTPCIWDGSAWW
jgi:uncharacterized membrane protein